MDLTLRERGSTTQDSGIDDEENLSAPLQRLLIENPRPSSPDSTATEELNGDTVPADKVSEILELLKKYFSDIYLTQDYFLLKHFRKHQEGWISLRFVASYKKLRKLSKNLECIREAVRQTDQFELNDDETKLRRTLPLPDYIKNFIPTRSVLLANLPAHLQSVASLSAYLAMFGSTSSIVLINPGRNFPAVLGSTIRNLPNIKQNWNALAEYDEISSAKMLVDHVARVTDGPEFAIEVVKSWNSKQRRPSTKSSTPKNLSRKTSREEHGIKYQAKMLAPVPACTKWNCQRYQSYLFTDTFPGHMISPAFRPQADLTDNWRHSFHRNGIR